MTRYIESRSEICAPKAVRCKYLKKAGSVERAHSSELRFVSRRPDAKSFTSKRIVIDVAEVSDGLKETHAW